MKVPSSIILNCGDIMKWKLAESPGTKFNVSYSN